jgi:hypothetical protein
VISRNANRVLTPHTDAGDEVGEDDVEFLLHDLAREIDVRALRERVVLGGEPP